MVKRIISSAIGIAIFVSVLFVSDKYNYIFNGVVSILCAISIGEIFFAKKYFTNKPLLICSIIFAAIVPFLRTPYFTIASKTICFIYIVALFAIMIIDKKNVKIEQIGLIFMLGTLIPFAFSTLVYLKDYSINNPTFWKRDGLFVLIMACAGAWIADTGAYFTGRFLGKHKLCPEISPKKTVEGFIGGIIFNIIIFIIGGIVYQNVFSSNAKVNIPLCAIIGLVTAVMGTLGDLSASFIKRSCNVKDFGNIMPGHGGIMDRFDSVMLVAPTVYIFVEIFQPSLWPLIVR